MRSPLLVVDDPQRRENRWRRRRVDLIFISNERKNGAQGLDLLPDPDDVHFLFPQHLVQIPHTLSFPGG